MCRLLAYVARKPTAAVSVLGDVLPAFVALSQQEHRDGWGLAWYEGERTLHTAKAPEPAYASAMCAQTVADLTSDAVIAHLRWATPGMALTRENTHPFSSGDIAFAHNGSVDPLPAVEELIAPHLRSLLVGTTDSERYFLALLSALEEREPVDALRATLAALHERTYTSSLNALLLTPRAVYVLADYDPHAPMTEQDPGYYRLSYRIRADAVVAGSSGMQGEAEWDTVPNGHALVIDRGSLRTDIVRIVDERDASTRKDTQSVWQGWLQR
jgi:predicted glutamine amidotransferase